MNKLPDIDLDLELDLDMDDISKEITKMEHGGNPSPSFGNSTQRTAIIGGMGNEAMLDLMEKMTSIKKPSNIEYVFYGNSHLAYTPGEMSRLSDKKVRAKADSRKKHSFNHTLAVLQSLKCNTVGMSCNSGHTFIRQIIPSFDLKLVDMVKEACYAAKSLNLPIILGTTSLIEDRLYETVTDNKSVVPRSAVLKQIMSSVYHSQRGVKAKGVNDWNYRRFKTALRECLSNNRSSQALILGCTELPLFFKFRNGQIYKDIPRLAKMKVIDPTMILAEKLVTTSNGLSPRHISHSEYRMPHSDIYPPTAFICTSIHEAIKIQSDILNETSRILSEDKYSSIKKGSYLHLPTMFFINCRPEIAKDFFDTIVEKDKVDSFNYKNKIIKHIEYIYRTNEGALK